RSSNRSARIAEVALQEQRRPLLAGSRLNVDPEQKIMFVDEHWVHVGAGIGVCQGWGVRVGLVRSVVDHFPEDELRAQTRDLYIPAGDVGLWQGAIRERSDPIYEELARAISSREPIAIELLYSDQVGAQRTITRFTLVPIRRDDADEATRLVSVARHWYLDRAGPR